MLFQLRMSIVAVLVSAGALAGQARSAQRGVYYPGPDREWERRTPAQVGLDAERLEQAISYAKANESKGSRDLEVQHYRTFGREPFGEGIGPFQTRGDATGVVLRHGYIVAEWGEPERVDMTFSVTKSFLSSTVGVAFDRGLIRSVRDTVRSYVGPIFPYSPDRDGRVDAERTGVQPIRLFETEHDRRITWDDLLRQVSDWEGTLWGKPEWADRPTGEPAQWATRPRNAPGSVYEYNDVRVNVLALAATNVWRRPLPQVLREYVMDPIDASPTWRWVGYENSWIELDGEPVQAVGGGGHWGGGMFIDARDMARFGYLTLRRGRWKDRQILSEAWVRMALTPTPAQPTYGFMNWFLNTDRKLWPSAPATAWAHLGNGTNMIFVDPDDDLVVVVRWIENGAIDGFLQRLLAAVRDRRTVEVTSPATPASVPRPSR
ncbi:MAG TPA: serine hydrolase [Longimicrobiales bacterium]|nr:serine hydrolase [Longimicrobiales bacterium]